MEQIKSIVKDVIKDIQAKQEQNPDGDIKAMWIRSARKKIAQHTKCRFFKKGKLYINAEDSAWLYELKLKKEEILGRLKKISKNKIKDISFKVGEIHGD